MRVHANAKLGPAGRPALVCLIREGASLRAAAARSGVSIATAHRWWHRWLDASARDRTSGVWLQDRSSGRIAGRDVATPSSRHGSAR
jgi:leucine-zipper of insertion element IS481